GGGPGRGRSPQQLGEERAIVDHCLPQILGTGPSGRVLTGDVARGAIVHYDVRMIDRNVFDALVEVADRVAAGLHDFADHAIGFGDRALRIVDESRLDLPPRVAVAPLVLFVQRPDVQPFDT